MEKVWFKLRQTYYPPPTFESLGTQTDTGPITLGHFIPSLQKIDFVLNRGAVNPFPPSMSVYRTESTPFIWNAETRKSVGAGVGAGAPIAAMAGLTLEASVQLAFARSVQGHEAYERLDTYIVQPSMTYIEDCLEDAHLAAHVQGKLLWKVFMITGIKVARKGSRTMSEQARQSAGGNITMYVLFSKYTNCDTLSNLKGCFGDSGNPRKYQLRTEQEARHGHLWHDRLCVGCAPSKNLRK